MRSLDRRCNYAPIFDVASKMTRDGTRNTTSKVQFAEKDSELSEKS